MIFSELGFHISKKSDLNANVLIVEDCFPSESPLLHPYSLITFNVKWYLLSYLLDNHRRKSLLSEVSYCILMKDYSVFFFSFHLLVHIHFFLIGHNKTRCER